MKRALLLTALLIWSTFALSQSPAPAKATGHTETANISAERVWSELIAGNRRFVAGKPKPQDLVTLRHTLAGGQHPRVIVVTCSDSRVPPELLFDQSLGELFVVRSAGNIADSIGVGSIEYAVEHLGASVLIVLGHQKCGAVTAACSGEKMPTHNLQSIVDKISPAVAEARQHSSNADLVEAAILENVHQSTRDILANSSELSHAQSEGKLTVIEAVYKLNSGEVLRLSKP